MKTMYSKFPGTCTACNGAITKGEFIAWSRRTGAQHGKCAGFYPPERPQDVRSACWTCGSPDGKFRPYAASTPVYCDECHALRQTASFTPDATDIAYEDQCAAACGLR